MGAQPKLSIIIVSYNTREILRDCLHSVYENIGLLTNEVFVVDNNSSDGSVEMITNEFPAATLICNSTNRGFAAANNQALLQSTGDYILLLNSDTLIIGDVLNKSVEYMQHNPLVGIMGCRVLNKDFSLQYTCFRWPSLCTLFLTASGISCLPLKRLHGYEKILSWQRDTEREVDVVTGCYLMVSRNAYNTIGGLDEDFFFYGEETDWCRRAREAGYKVKFSPVGEIIHLGGASGDSQSSQRGLMLLNAIVRLNRKHSGIMWAIAAYIIMFFNEVIRGILFSLYGLIKDKKFYKRGKTKLIVCSNFHKAWPKKVKDER